MSLARADVRDPALDLAGVHLHIGRQSADPAVWSGAVDALCELLARLRDLWAGLDAAPARRRGWLSRPA